MRFMLQVEIDTPTGNKLVSEGKIGQTIERVVGNAQPEVAYFYERSGRRAFTLVVDVADTTYLPALLEPMWVELGATVEAIPVMSTDELQVALSRLG
ncbi:MAG TPA: hypothetical protein VK461_09290 [Acidimicrobiales bacterium]|nr:hypothetical protein [Acidimicrobiales bacterium]